MSPYRIWAAIVTVCVAIPFIVLAINSFGPEQLVVPEVSVTTQQGSQSTNVQAILEERTNLQGWRQEVGPAPGKAAPAADPAFDAQLKFLKGNWNSKEQVQGWLQDRPESDLMRSSENITGNSSLPYPEANSFEQPGGRTWREVHNDQVRFGGGWLLFGIILALALFLLFRGRIPLVSGFSGKILQRFNGFERANHWMTATAFVLMALTGLVLIYGKPLLLPFLGAGALGTLARGSAWLHMASAVPFVLGLLCMIVLWVRDNVPTWRDWEWLKQGGGFLRNEAEHPPAEKFNAGQKIVFWSVVLGGLALLASGLALMFPFFWFGYDGMQLAQTSHAVIGLLMIALIFGHIYIGSVGMVGAFDAMWSGGVDRNWAKEHHSLWFARLSKRERKKSHRKAQPAE